MPLNPNLTEAERLEAEMLMAVGRLAKYFHTPIPFFMDLDPVELNLWLEIMDELITQENKAIEKEMKKGGR